MTNPAYSTREGKTYDLGPLGDLPGFWEGTGFSITARPNYSGGSENGIFLQLNMLNETIEFTPIGSPVFNRGSVQEDIAISGLTYVHRVTDATNGFPLHVESGQWLNIPATTKPESEASIARLATIPHGNAVCTVGQAADVVLPTSIPPANTVPFEIGGEAPPAGTRNPFSEYDLSQPTEFRTNPLPAAITQEIVDDPAVVLRQALEGQNIKKITRLITTTDAAGVSNIPFITSNADTPFLESVFAIEVVENPTGEMVLQLQYAQTALLNFRGMSFPHVTVGTLVKAF